MNEILAPGMHGARVRSLANGVAGLLKAAGLSVHTIEQASYSSLVEITPKSSLKQVDRRLGNDSVHIDMLMRPWCKHLADDSTELCIATNRLRRPQHAVPLPGHAR